MRTEAGDAREIRIVRPMEQTPALAARSHGVVLPDFVTIETSG
jgi:hypothetical protein